MSNFPQDIIDPNKQVDPNYGPKPLGNGSGSVNSNPNQNFTNGQQPFNTQEFDDPINVQPDTLQSSSYQNFENDLGSIYSTQDTDPTTANQANSFSDASQTPTTPTSYTPPKPVYQSPQKPSLANYNQNNTSPATSNFNSSQNTQQPQINPNQKTPGNSSFGAIFTQLSNLVILAILIGLLASGFVWDSLWAILVFWIAALVAFKYNANFRWIVIAVAVAGILIKFQIHPIALGSLILVLLPALFLGFNPKLSLWAKYLAGLVSIILGLLVAVPMSQQGSLNYVVSEYGKDGLFTNVVDAAYQTAGSPKLSASEIENDFKKQISSEISRLAQEQTTGKISQEDELKLAKLCEQAPNYESLKDTCASANKQKVNETVSAETSKQVDNQIQNLKDQVNKTPQVQFATNLLNQTATEQQNFITSPYYIPVIVFFLIYIIIGGLLALVSWPLGFLLDRLTLS
ncbi:MAG: hypothetical protein OHK0017_13680 [Patescibacteria group bacterium]